MLKWTGGSRRTVSTSRKSTQSKQKQYFEQKRRLQQVPGTDNSSDTNKWDHPSDARSLDILSFVNLATVAQNKESVHTQYNSSTQALYNPSELSTPVAFKKLPVHLNKRNEAYDLKTSCASQEDNGDFSKLSPAMAVKKIVSGLSHKPNESGFLSQTSSLHESYAGAALRSADNAGKFEENIPSIPLQSKSSDVKQKGKSTMQSEVSLLDLLDDEDSERNLMWQSCNEAYVAFSIKGLGKVEVETPPSSPVSYQRGCPEPPQRSARCTWNKEFQSIPCRVKIELDSTLRDRDFLNGFRQSERMRDYGPFIDNMDFAKESQFEDIYIPDSFDNFEGSPECEQDNPDCRLDGAFDEHIRDQIWEGSHQVWEGNHNKKRPSQSDFISNFDACEETSKADLPGKRKDRLWDTHLFKSENFDGTSPNEDVFDPILNGFEEYDDFPTLSTRMKTSRRFDLYSARAGPSCSPSSMENKHLPIDSYWKRDIPKFEMKSDCDGLFSQPVWPLKDEVADLLDTASLRSEESCSSTRVKEVKNYGFQSSPQKHKINYMDDFQMNPNLTLKSPKLNNILHQAHQKSTCRTKSSSSGSKLKKTSFSAEDLFLDSDPYPECMMYTKTKEPSKNVIIEQRSGTNLDFGAKGEEKHDVLNNPEGELPKGMKSSSVGEVRFGMKERQSESVPKCDSEKHSDEAENERHSEADKCSFEGSPIIFEACANGTPNTPVRSQQFERCNLTEDNCDKISPFSSQAENQEDVKGKCDAQYQVMLQSYVFQLLCVQKVLLEASGKDKMK